jgi:transcriptional regulator slyA
MERDDVIYQCLQTVRAFNKSLNSVISRKGVFSSEWTIMKVIHQGRERSQTELAKELGVEAAAISKTLAKLEDKGLIEKHSLLGQRGKFIALTEKGETLMDPIGHLVDKHRTAALAGLSEEELHKLLESLKKIENNLVL